MSPAFRCFLLFAALLSACGAGDAWSAQEPPSHEVVAKTSAKTISPGQSVSFTFNGEAGADVFVAPYGFVLNGVEIP